MPLKRLSHLPVAIALLLVVACGDISTGPKEHGGAAASPGAGPGYACNTIVNGVYVMCPVSPAPSEPTCDPWSSIDWCEGDGGGGCQMSSPGTGTPDSPVSATGCDPSSGSGPTRPGGSQPPGGEPLPPSHPGMEGTDMDRDTIPPSDCLDPTNTEWEQVYCRSAQPDSSQMRKTRQALDQIAARGGECAVVAQKGRELLATGRITFFVGQDGDAGGYGHRNTGIQIDSSYPEWYDYPGSGFEKVLVHEIDHVLGLNHTDAAGFETPHTAQCS